MPVAFQAEIIHAVLTDKNFSYIFVANVILLDVLDVNIDDTGYIVIFICLPVTCLLHFMKFLLSI